MASRHVPHYKANRKKGREESDTDWASIFAIIGEIREELREIFPWKFVNHKRAEGDDVIAALVHYLQDNETTTGGIFDEPQEILQSNSSHIPTREKRSLVSSIVFGRNMVG